MAISVPLLKYKTVANLLSYVLCWNNSVEVIGGNEQYISVEMMSKYNQNIFGILHSSVKAARALQTCKNTYSGSQVDFGVKVMKSWQEFTQGFCSE